MGCLKIHFTVPRQTRTVPSQGHLWLCSGTVLLDGNVYGPDVGLSGSISAPHSPTTRTLLSLPGGMACDAAALDKYHRRQRSRFRH